MVSIYNVQYAKINLHRFLLLGVKFRRVNVGVKLRRVNVGAKLRRVNVGVKLRRVNIGVKLRRVNVGVKLRRVNVGVKLRRVNETAECEYSRLNAYTLRYIDNILKTFIMEQAKKAYIQLSSYSVWKTLKTNSDKVC